MAGTGLPLAGVRVIEMTHMVMGPTCGMILAQLGAEVIKVEPPQGDKTRALGGMGVAFFPLFNRGKRSVVLDFAKAEDRDTMHALLATADVFVENFRDGQLEKQGLGPDELRKRYPQLIVCGHKGFLSGPYEHRPALDEVVQMMSGLAAMTGTRDKPQRVGSSANDIMGGMFGVIAILARSIRSAAKRRAAPTSARSVRELPVPGRPAHGRIRDDRQQAALDAGARTCLADLRHLRRRRRRAHLHRRRDRRPLAELCGEFGLKEFLDDPKLRTPPTASWRAPDPSAGRREDQALGRRGAVTGWIRSTSASRRSTGPRTCSTDPHVLRPGGLVNNQRLWQGVPGAGAADRMERQPYRRGLKVPALGADTETVRAELEQQK